MRPAFSTLPAASLLMLASAAHAADPGIASYTVDTSVTLLSDLRTRGISDSLGKPALKLSMLAAHESGLVALAELATVSRKQFLDGDGLGVTLAGGYRFGDPEKWHFGLGLATEFFPGAKFDAPHGFDFVNFVPTDFRSTNYNSAFAVIEVGWGAIEGRILNVLSKTYRGADTGGVCGSMLAYMADPTQALDCYARGDHGSRGTWLVDLDYKHPITPATTLNLHAGYQKVANFSEANFTDWRIGVTHKHWGFEWNADWVATNTKVRELYLTPDGNDLHRIDNAKLVVSVAKHF
jgi:hypothetical protein